MHCILSGLWPVNVLLATLKSGPDAVYIRQQGFTVLKKSFLSIASKTIEISKFFFELVHVRTFVLILV